MFILYILYGRWPLYSISISSSPSSCPFFLISYILYIKMFYHTSGACIFHKFSFVELWSANSCCWSIGNSLMTSKGMVIIDNVSLSLSLSDSCIQARQTENESIFDCSNKVCTFDIRSVFKQMILQSPVTDLR